MLVGTDITIPEERSDIIQGNVILFNDKKSKLPPSSRTGYNQTGFFISKELILVCRKRKVYQVHIDELKGEKVKIISNSEIDGSKISTFFENTKTNYRLFNLGWMAL
jgi:hypothetical protein